jgi:hypothetical protein
LSDVYEAFANPSVSQKRFLHLSLLPLITTTLSHNSYLDALYLTIGDIEDKWCIDSRGVLTLCVTKNTYQRLGLVGNRLRFKHCPEQYGA